MSESLNPRVEIDVKRAVKEMTEGGGTLSATAKELINLGIAVRKEELEPRIKGPFGLPRPFAELSLSDEMSELRTEINDETKEQLVQEFDNKPNTAAREAIRLGVMTVAGEKLSVEGPAEGPRPFAQIEIGDLDDADAKDIADELQSRL